MYIARAFYGLTGICVWFLLLAMWWAALRFPLYNCGLSHESLFYVVKPVRWQLMPHVTHVTAFVQLALVYV